MGGLALIPAVGASLLAKNSQAPRSFRKHALSLTFFASKLAPTDGGTGLSVRPLPGRSFVSPAPVRARCR
ncbi:hypothetical protein CUU62_25420 [Pseudomonas sp. WP001]|nr:hypothetical protein CUU62_25420 [Pseudomonas sp. WP001]